MKYYLAPLEGVTGYLYRMIYHEFFHPMDKYFTPFLVPNLNKGFTSRELNDILPEHNQGMYVVPQILTNHAKDFIRTMQKLEQFGYHEVNLNLGCPSRTVVSKGRGSGFLAKREELDRFLNQIFSETEIKISIKTRLGKESPEEFYELIKIYNQYPLEELIIHPRIQTDFYKNTPNFEVFGDALKLSKHPLCYNGDIFDLFSYERVCTTFPDVQTIMLGRGIIGNPGLLDHMVNGKALDKQSLRQFHDRLLGGYQELLSGDTNVLFKMKEIWCYMLRIFEDADKCGKKIKKSEHLINYQAAVNELFDSHDLLPQR